MQATTLLHWAVTFYIGITLINCEDWYYKNDLQLNWTPDVSPLYNKPHLSPTNDNANKIDRSKQNNDVIPVASTYHNYEDLSPNEFPFWVVAALPREIFSQPNPLVYLLQRISTLRNDLIKRLNFDVKTYLRLNKFPSYYVPYAKMLSSLLTCQPDLQKLRRAIRNIRYFANSHSSSFGLPTEFATAELSAVFSPDIFADPNPPVVILEKIVELPEKAVSDLISELRNISLYGGLTQYNAFYAEALGSFLQNTAELKILREYNSKIKNATTKPTK